MKPDGFALGVTGVDHYENFPVASLLLPTSLRRPVALIYRFAREADDFADEGDAAPHVRLQQLAEFRSELQRIRRVEAPGMPWFCDLAQIIREYGLPIELFEDLLSAFSQDVVKSRYANYAEVLDYCRRSANPVGRLLLVLYGESRPEAQSWSDAICSSLQLINFLQDIAVDYRKGRIYLALDELHAAGLTENDIAHAQTGPAWQKFMHSQVARARSLLYSGAPLGRTLKGRIGLEMRMIIAGGARILEKIDRASGDVFRHRPVLRPVDWPLMVLRSL